MFKFLMNFHTIFHSGCVILHSYQQYTRVPIFPHPHWHLLFSVCVFFLKGAVITAMRWYLLVVLICISLMVGDVEQLFTYLVSFSSLNIFKIADLKSLSCKSNIWTSSETVFIDYFFPVFGLYFLVSLHIS